MVVVPIFNRKIISTFDPRAAGAGMLIAMVLNNPLSLISYQKHGGLQRTLAVSQRYLSFAVLSTKHPNVMRIGI